MYHFATHQPNRLVDSPASITSDDNRTQRERTATYTRIRQAVRRLLEGRQQSRCQVMGQIEQFIVIARQSQITERLHWINNQ